MGEIGQSDRLPHSVIRVKHAVSHALSGFVSTQVDAVTKGSLKLYDVAIAPQISKHTANKIRPSVLRTAEVVGVSLVAAEAVIAVIGVIKGIQWMRKLQQKVIAPAQALDYSMMPPPTPHILEPHVANISPEREAYNALFEQIQLLLDTKEVSPQLQNIMLHAAQEGGFHPEGAAEFRQTAVDVLTFLAGEGREGLEARKMILRMKITRLDGIHAMKVDKDDAASEIVLDLIGHLQELDRAKRKHSGGTDNYLDLMHWGYSFHGVGLRELLGVDPRGYLHDIDDTDFAKGDSGYLAFVKKVMDAAKPISHDWPLRR